MTCVISLLIIAALWIPGLAVVHSFAPRLRPEHTFVFAPAVTIVLYSVGGIAGWMYPAQFPLISWTWVGGCTLVGLAVLSFRRARGALRTLDPMLPAGYLLLVLFATQLTLLPIQIPKVFPFPLNLLYWVPKDLLSVRIQALHHELPIDNLISYRFADLMRRGVDFRAPREFGCGDRPAIAPGQHITARTPLMALVGVHFMTMFGPSTPVDRVPDKMIDINSDAAYVPFYLAGACLNALAILPAYLLGLRLFGQRAARIALLLLAANYGMILQTDYIWPKALAGYFGGLFAYAVICGCTRYSILGSLASLTYYSHPCGGGLILGCVLYHVLSQPRRMRAALQLVPAGLFAAVLLVPWNLWAIVWLRTPGNLISQNIGQSLDQGYFTAANIRMMNVLRTVIPHLVCPDPWLNPVNLARDAFFTLPGMLGLVLVPFFAASLAQRRHALITLTMGLVPLLMTGVVMGESHGGLAPFGPFLFIPIAATLSAGMLVSLSRWELLGVTLACLAEQAVVIWLSAYGPHWQLVSIKDPLTLLRLIALFAVEGSLAGLLILVCLRHRAEAVLPVISGSIDRPIEARQAA